MDSPRIKKGYFLLNNKKYVTRNGINLIGRNREATVIMKNTSISQHHALLVILDDDKHYLSDFNSSNGTFLDSVKLQPLRLYEVKQGASVQFADIKSTYFKVTDNTEINTQGSESSQVVNDTLFNANTQLFNSSIFSVQSANKTQEKSHITDHGYTKLLEDDENFLNAASASADICSSPCDNHVNEVINDGDNSNSCDTNKAEEEVQESLINHMNDHGYYKKTQKEDIHDVPTPVKNKNFKSSLAKAIHDLPTQIVGGFDNDSMQVQNTSIHELPTQMMHLPDVLEMSNLKDVAVSNSSDLKKKVTNKPSTLSVHKLSAHLSNIPEISVPKDVEDLSKEKVTQKSCALEKSAEAIHDLPTQIVGGFDNDSRQGQNTSIHELPTQMIHLPDVLGTSNLKDVEVSKRADLLKEKVTNKPSTLSVHKLSAHLSNIPEISVPKDVEDLSKEKVTQKSCVLEFVTNTNSEQTHDEPPVTDESVLETKCNNSNDIIDETLPDNLQQEQNPANADENSTDSIDFMTMQAASQHFTNNLSSEDFDAQSKLHSSQQNRKVRYVIESGDETDVESEPELWTSKIKRTKKKNVIDSSQETEAELADDKVGKAPDSETDDEIDISKDGRVGDGKEKSCLNEVSSDKKINVEFEPKFKGDGSTKTMKAKPVIEDSDSETDVDIDISKGGIVSDGKGKPCKSEVTTDKKTNAEFELKDGSTNIIKARPIIEDSDSETDVEIDIIKDQKTLDANEDKSLHNEMNNDKRATAETKTNSSSKNVDTEIDSDSGSKLIIKVSKKKNVIESSDDTDVEDEIIKIDKEDSETDAESDNLSANQKTKTDSEVDAGKAEKTAHIDISESTKEAVINQANNEENTEDNCQQDLFQSTKIDEDKKDEDTPDNKNESVNMNSNSRLDDTDVIPATQNSFVGEIDFDFNTQDLNYAAAKLEKAKKGHSQEKIRSNTEDTLNSEEPLGDSFSLALTNSIVEAKHQGLKDEDSTIDLFLQATQKNAEAEETSGNISRDNENESIFLKPTQKLDFKNGGGGDDDDEIFIQPTQQLSENQGNSEPSQEVFLQPQIVITEAKSKDDSIFIKPTHKLATGRSVEEKLESIFRPTQPEDDSIFLEATQKLSEKGEQDEVTFLKPAQVKNVHKNKLTSKPNQAEDNIFMQATQVISEEGREVRGGNAAKAKIEESDVNINKKVVEDNDIFVQATQISLEVQNDNKEKIEEPDVNINKKDDDIFVQATQISPELQNDNKEKTESQSMNSNIKLADKDIFVQPTQVVTNELKENPPGHSVESQLEVMFASQNIRFTEDENPRPENPLVNLLSSLEIQPEVIEITDDFPEETSSKENKSNAGPSKKRARTKSTDSNDDVNINRPKRGIRKSPQLSNDMETTKRSTRSTRNTTSKITEESDVPKVLNEEEKLDLLFKTTKIMESDIFLETAEPAEKPIGRTRRSPQPVGKKAATCKDNENLKSLRKKTSLATVEEELPSKLDEISTSLKYKVSAAGQQLEDEGKLQSKKRNVKSTKCANANVGEGTSSDNVETVVKLERSRRQKAKKDEEDIGNRKEITNIHETPHRSTKRIRNNNIEIMHISDSSNDFEVPLRSDLPSTSNKTTKESADTKKSTKLKDGEEVTEEMTPSGKGKIKSKILKPECDQKVDVKEMKQRTKRTNSVANDEIVIKNVKKTRFDSTENENTNKNTSESLGNETPSTSRRARSKRTQSSVTIEEDELKPGTDTSDDEFVPSVTRKKRKNVLDSDSDDIALPSSVKTIPGTPIRKKLLQLPDNLLSTPERLKRKLKPKVVFTMLDSPELESLIRSLGGSVVDSVEASTVLVTSGVKRSQKLLSAVGLGKPICSPKWLQECRKAGSFVDPWDHILVDDEAEKKWDFSLKESLQRSVDSKLLENYIVHLIVNNAQDVLKGAIESCGGKCVTRAPPKNSTANYIIVSTPENKNKYTKFLKQISQPMVVAPEAIFDGVLRQELHFKDHKLT